VPLLGKDKEDASLVCKDEFERFTKKMDLRVYAAYDEYDIEKQKNRNLSRAGYGSQDL
jgi:hypothetical protein